jgi:hypothetical protein
MALTRLLRFRSTVWPTLGYFAAMAVLLISERIIAQPGPARTALRAAAVAGLIFTLAARGWRVLKKSGDARRYELWIALAYLVGCAAVVIQSVAGEEVIPAVIWPLLWLGSALPIILMEMSLASTTPGEGPDDGRVRAAAQSGLEMVLVLATVTALNYVAANTERKVDLSYLQDTRPSIAMIQLSSTLKEPIEVRVFYPELHEVRERLRSYFAQLKRHGAKLDVAFLDEAIDHAAAIKYRVQGNGLVVVAKDTRRVPIELGLDWDVAKRQLQDFDAQLQWAVNKVARSRKIYFLTGHGEVDTGKEVSTKNVARIENPLKGIQLHTQDTGPDSSRSFTELHKLLRTQGYDVEQLGTLGVVQSIPEDAVALFLVGPTTPLFSGEINELRRYLSEGGRLFVYLDPDNGSTLEDLLTPYRIRFVPKVLANDYIHMRKSSQPSDNTQLVTTSFSTHPAVMTVSRDTNTYRMLFTRAGYLEEIPSEGGSSSIIYFFVHADPQTFADLNGNYVFDSPTESRRAYELAAAVVSSTNPRGAESRMLVYADVDVVSDALMSNPGNRQAVLDALTYVSMDEEIPLTVAAADPMIRHTQQQDKVWFYSVSFGIPVIVLVGGLGSIRRGRRRTSR